MDLFGASRSELLQKLELPPGSTNREILDYIHVDSEASANVIHEMTADLKMDSLGDEGKDGYIGVIGSSFKTQALGAMKGVRGLIGGALKEHNRRIKISKDIEARVEALVDCPLRKFAPDVYPEKEDLSKEGGVLLRGIRLARESRPDTYNLNATFNPIFSRTSGAVSSGSNMTPLTHTGIFSLYGEYFQTQNRERRSIIMDISGNDIDNMEGLTGNEKRVLKLYKNRISLGAIKRNEVYDVMREDISDELDERLVDIENILDDNISPSERKDVDLLVKYKKSGNTYNLEDLSYMLDGLNNLPVPYGLGTFESPSDEFKSASIIGAPPSCVEVKGGMIRNEDMEVVEPPPQRTTTRRRATIRPRTTLSSRGREDRDLELALKRSMEETRH